MRPPSLKCLVRYLTLADVYISLSGREQFLKGEQGPMGMAVLPSVMLKKQNSRIFYNSVQRHPNRFLTGISTFESAPGT